MTTDMETKERLNRLMALWTVAEVYDGAWIGVDLDGTLAKYDGWRGMAHIGEPIPGTCEVVKDLLDMGVRCKVFTARVCAGTSMLDKDTFNAALRDWSLKHLGTALQATSDKDWRMVAIIDDRAIAVEFNTGRFL